MRVVAAPSPMSVVARRPADANSGAASSGSANGQFSFWARTESASQAARSSPGPAAVARPQWRALDELNVRAAANGAGLAPAAQASAASIAACNASSPGMSKASAATAIAERHCPADPAASARQARSRRPAGPGSAPERLRWSASRSAASSSLRPARGDAGGRGSQGEALAPGAGPGRVFAHDRIEPGERGAGEKPGFGLAFRRVDGARPGRERRRARRSRGPGWRTNWGARACRNDSARRRFWPAAKRRNRRARRRVCMSDNLALSDIARFI